MYDIAKLAILIETGDIKKAQAELNRLTGQGQKTETSINKLNKSFGGLVSTMAGFGAAFGAGAFFTKLTQTSIQFQSSLSKVQAVTRSTQSQMGELSKVARELGATTSFSAAQAAEGMSFLGMAGFKTNEIIKAMPATLQLAAAGGLDLARAADLASNALSGFGLKADEMGRVSDVLAATASRANTSVSQLGEALSYAAPFAASLGVDIESTAAAIGVLSDAGIQASRAGTGLGGVFRQLSKVTSEGEKVLAKYGISLDQVDISSRGLIPVLETISEANLTAGDAIALFGSEAGVAAQILLKNIDRNKELEESLRGARGEAEKMSKVMKDNLQGDLEALNSAYEELLLAIDQTSGYSDKLRGHTQDLTEALRNNKTAVAELAKAFIPFLEGGVIGAGLIALGVGFVFLLKRINPVMAALTTMAGIIGKLNDITEERAQLDNAIIENARQIANAEKAIQEAKKNKGGLFGMSDAEITKLEDRLTSLQGKQERLRKEFYELAKAEEEQAKAADKAAEAAKKLEEEQKKLTGGKKGNKGATVELTDAQNDYLKALKEKIALSEAESKQGKELTTGQKERIKVEQQFGKAFAASLQFMFDAIDAAEEETRVREDLADVLEEIEKDLIKLGKAEDKSAKASKKRTGEIEKGNAEIREEIRRTKGLIDPLQNLEASYYDVAAAKLEEKAATIRPGEERDQILREAAANKERARLLRERTLVEYEKGIEEANQEFLEGFLGAFERGTDEGIDYLKNQLKRQAFQILINATIGNVGALGGALSNVFGTGGSSLISGGGFGGGIGNPLSIGNAFGSFGSGFNNSALMFVDAALGLGNTIANTFGDSAFSDAILNNSQTIGQVGATLGAIGTAVSGFNALKNGQYGSAAGQGIGYAFGGPIGAAIGGAIGGFIDSSFSGEKRRDDTAILQNGRLTVSSGNGRPLSADFTQQITQGTIDAINTTLKNLGSAAQLGFFEGKLQTSGKGRGGVYAMGAFTDGTVFGDRRAYEQNRSTSPNAELAFELYLEQLDQVFLQSLQAVSGDFAQNIDEYLTSLGDVELLSPEQLVAARANVALLNAVNTEFGKMEGHLGALANQSLQTVQTFLQAVGGLENFNGLFSGYVSSIYDESEQLALAQRNLTQAFERLNVDAIPKTRDEFQALVESLDVTTAEGANLYAQLLQLAPAFAQVTDSVEQAQERAQQKALQLAQDNQRAAEQAVSQAESNLRQAFNARRSELNAIINQASQAENQLRQIYNRERGVIEQTIRGLRGLVDGIRNFRDQITREFLNVSFNTQSRQAALLSSAQAVRSGDVGAFSQLQSDTQAYLQEVSDNSGSFIEVAKATAFANEILADLESSGLKQISNAELQLKELEDSVSRLISIDEQLVSVDSAIRAVRSSQQAATVAQQELKAIEQQQLSLLGSIDEGINSIPEAIQALSQARESAAQAAATLSNGGTVGSLIGTTNPFGTVTALSAQESTAANFFAEVYGNRFASGGFVSGPGTGTSDSIMARLSNGEFVVNARSTSQMRPMLEQINQGRMPMMGMSDPAMLRELQMLREEVMNMRAETRATAVNTGKSAKLMERFDDQDALAVRVLA